MNFKEIEAKFEAGLMSQKEYLKHLRTYLRRKGVFNE